MNQLVILFGFIVLVVGGLFYMNQPAEVEQPLEQHQYSIPPYSSVQPEVSKDIYYKDGKAYVPINVTWQEVTQCFNMYNQVWEDCR
jgi:hypothetical protein